VGAARRRGELLIRVRAIEEKSSAAGAIAGVATVFVKGRQAAPIQ